jgi:cold shock CspA family protein
MGTETVREGVVRDFDPVRGMGIVVTQEGEELPVHRTAIADEGLRALHAGDIVEFSLGRNRFGRRCAVNVRRIGWEEGGSDEPREWTF